MLPPLQPTPSYTSIPPQTLPSPHQILTTPVAALNPSIKSNKRKHPEEPSSDIAGKLRSIIEDDVDELHNLGWEAFVHKKRGRGDLGAVHNINHKASRLLKHYKYHGAPVKLKTPPWSHQRILQALNRGPHQSCNQHIDFLEEEFIEMVQKGQWVILPYTATIGHLKDVRVSPPGVVPQAERRPRWICDYSWSDINAQTVPLAPTEAMQFGNAFDRILRHILLANPSLGPVSLIKVDIADGFYRVDVNPMDVPKLGVVFPSRYPNEHLIAFPLTLPMGWTNSPPIFCAVTETAADLANAQLQSPLTTPQPPHPLSVAAAKVVIPESSEVSASSQEPMPKPKGDATASLPSRDPYLPLPSSPTAYVDIFMDDFIALAQSSEQHRVRNTLLHAIDQVFRPLDSTDTPFRTEPISIKKLRKGDCTWSTCKKVLGWVIDTVNLTISLPERRALRLAEILASIPSTQRRISVRKWHKILGELRSMAIALPGARSLFSHMQAALQLRVKGRLSLHKGVHQALSDFRWMAANITSRPTRIAELVPLLPTIAGDHDASKLGAGGILYPAPHATVREPLQSLSTVIWRVQWPQSIQDQLISDSNPGGTITINDLELAGSLLQLEAAVQSFDCRERTVLNRTDNMATLFWSRKGSTTTTACAAQLLRLHGIHQRFHRYIPRHDYIPGLDNKFADALSRLFHLSDADFLTHMQSLFPQLTLSYRIWTPSPQWLSAVISALHNKTCKPESVLAEPPPPMPIGNAGQPTPTRWPSTPLSRPSKTKYPSSKSLQSASVVEPLLPASVPYALGQLRTTYGRLAKRSSNWAWKTHV